MAEEKERIIKSSGVPVKSFSSFQVMRNMKEFCDITFQIGNECISAHRVIIAAAIPYFRDTLSSKNEKNAEGITMPDVEPSAFKCLIEFAYNCEVKINDENARSLLVAACHLGVEVIIEECCDYLADNLEPGNALNIRAFADNLNCSKLLKAIDSYVKENFLEISKTKDFLNCSLNYLKVLCSEDDLNVDNEELVFEVVLNWVKEAPGDRSSQLPELLRVVRLPLLSLHYLTDIVEREELIRQSIACRDLLDEAKSYSLFPEKRKTVYSFPFEPRQSTKTTRAVVNNGNERIYNLHGESKYTVQYFDLEKKKWLAGGSHVFHQNHGATAAVHNKIFHIDWGFTLQYDAFSNIYKYLSCVPSPRIFARACCLKNKIYVCGGLVGWIASNTVECFDPEQNKWTRVCDLGTSRWGASVLTLDEYIFALGGKDNSSVHDSVERYDQRTDKWRFMSPMLTKRCLAGAAALNGKIYICGGRTLPHETNVLTVSAAEVYDPVTESWQFISPMRTARCSFTLLSYCRKLYIVGGEDANSKLVHNFEVYDPTTGEWTSGSSTDAAHYTSGAVVLYGVHC